MSREEKYGKEFARLAGVYEELVDHHAYKTVPEVGQRDATLAALLWSTRRGGGIMSYCGQIGDNNGQRRTRW